MTSGTDNQAENKFPLPDSMLVWNLSGAGYQSLGKSGKPERWPIPRPSSDQLLVRMDSVGICYSDVKLIQQGGNHPKLKGLDLEEMPTRPGHEVSFTVIRVGRDLQDKYRAGGRFAIQPEVIQNGNSKTYGFNIPGGLTQYQLIGPELLSTDEGTNLVEVDQTLSWAEASLLEPWGSVIAGYDPKRIKPKTNGRMWIIGGRTGLDSYGFSEYLELPERVLLTGIEGELKKQIQNLAKDVQIRDLVEGEGYASISAEYSGREGFDDIVILEPQSSQQVVSLISLAARGGKVNLVGTERLAKPASLDVQRIHYDHVSIVGTAGSDIAESYRSHRNRRELRPGGTAVFFGAGGPIGQMHLQRAIRMSNPPHKILVIDIDQKRLNHLQDQIPNVSQVGGSEVRFLNPFEDPGSLIPEIRKSLDQEWIDDAVVLVPDPGLMEDALSILKDDGMINLFAGTPSGTFISVDLSRVFLGNLQLAGTSGLKRHHQQEAFRMGKEGEIDLNDPIAAVGGMNAAAEAIKATEDRVFPGRIIIYPQLVDLPLMSIQDLFQKYPAMMENLGGRSRWTLKAERALMEIHGVKFD
jgi:threonine dehydrogenase-like Zn-dependent dehydrogenase